MYDIPKRHDWSLHGFCIILGSWIMNQVSNGLFDSEKPRRGSRCLPPFQIKKIFGSPYCIFIFADKRWDIMMSWTCPSKSRENRILNRNLSAKRLLARGLFSILPRATKIHVRVISEYEIMSLAHLRPLRGHVSRLAGTTAKNLNAQRIWGSVRCMGASATLDPLTGDKSILLDIQVCFYSYFPLGGVDVWKFSMNIVRQAADNAQRKFEAASSGEVITVRA